MHTMRVFLLVGSLLIGSGFALGQERSASLPNVDVPTKLEPYADLALVQKNARRAIELLATAQLKLSPYPEPVSDKGPKQITPECDSAEFDLSIAATCYRTQASTFSCHCRSWASRGSRDRMEGPPRRGAASFSLVGPRCSASGRQIG